MVIPNTFTEYRTGKSHLNQKPDGFQSVCARIAAKLKGMYRAFIDHLNRNVLPRII